MVKQRQISSWWQTMPGIFTGIAVVITAVGGVLAVLYQRSILDGKPLSTAPDKSSAEPAIQSMPPTTPASFESHAARNKAAPHTGLKQVQAGHYVFKLLASTLQPYATDVSGNPTKLSLRLSIRVTDVMGITDYVDRNTIRLLVDGAELIPQNTIDFAVGDKQSVVTDALFVIPADAAKTKLLVGQPLDATGTISIDLKLLLSHKKATQAA